jgi:hypothetical protein
MNRRRLTVMVASLGLAIAGLAAPIGTQSAGAKPFNYKNLAKIQKRLLSGALSFQLEPVRSSGIKPKIVPGGGDDEDGGGADGLPNTPPSGYASAGGAGSASNYTPSGNGACSVTRGSNIKVNQNCLNITDSTLQGRGQANNETSIAQDPLHPKHLVASNNDYRRGDGTCGASYSVDRGKTWNDATVPNGFTQGDKAPRQYWQGGGDTSVAWDTRGNSYLSCQLFNRGSATDSNPDQSSAFAIYRSTGNNGASFNFPGRYAKVVFDHDASTGVFEDKQLLTVDNNVHSPYRDRVYVTYTEFAADGSGYIYETHSSDYGQTFSAPVVVSRTSSLCTNTFGLGTPQGTCNENQFSDPFVGRDGALYVAYANFNNTVTGDDNRNQMLLSKSTDGGASFGAPVKVGDYYDLPDCMTYQGDDPGRACVPEKGSSTRSVFRATNYPSGSVDPRNPKRVVVTYGSYINKDSKESNGCTPAGFDEDFGTNLFTGVKKAGACNNDILVSTSTNAGSSFSGAATDPRNTTTVTRSRAQRTTDQFWQWSTFAANGKLVVSYYDRQYGRDEFNGSSDVSLTASHGSGWRTTRVTTGSMPAPTEFYGDKGGLFYGDYTGLTAVSDAYPIWMDTRSTDLFVCPNTATGPGSPPKLCGATETNGQRANDEDIYTARVRLP